MKTASTIRDSNQDNPQKRTKPIPGIKPPETPTALQPEFPVEENKILTEMSLTSKVAIAAIAAIITIVVRLTVFSEDCNLLIVGITFLLVLSLCYGASWLYAKHSEIRDESQE